MRNYIAEGITIVWETVHAFTEGLFKTLDDGRINRRAVLWFAIYCQYEALKWAISYANLTLATEGFSDFMGAAAMIAAILTPVAGLLGAAIKFYNEGKAKEMNSTTE